ncbi:GyrI-like domain-containing protein [soil metagenome]
MRILKIKQFIVIGISVRTSNEAGKAAVDIPALWNTFLSEEIAAKIPHKLSDSIYCIYTDYEKDHTKPYTTILGCKVESLENIPVGMMGKIIEEGSYTNHIAKGNLLQGIVFNEWTRIWNSTTDRAFTADYEVYDERAKNPENAEVDIFVAVK